MNSAFFCPLVVIFLSLATKTLQAQDIPNTSPPIISDYSIQELDSLLQFFRQEGIYSKIIPHAQVAVEKAAQAYGKQDTIYAKMLYYLGLGYHYANRDHINANPYYQEAIAIQKNTIPKELPYANSLTAQADIFWYSTGEYQKAEPLLIEALQITEEAAGLNNLIYAKALAKLATLYKFMGRYDPCENMLKESLQIVAAVESKNHPTYEELLQNLGNLYLNTKKLKQAESIFLESKEILQNGLGKQHTNYAKLLINLGSTYEQMGRIELAESLYLEAKTIFNTNQETNSPAYVRLLNNLAILYQNISKYEQSEPLYLESMEIIKAAMGDQNPRYASLLNNLANLYKSMGRNNDAERCYQQCTDLWRATVGDQHPDYATSIKNLGQLYINTKNYGVAEPLFKEALQVIEKTVGKTHPHFARTQQALGKLYLYMKKNALAENNLLAALQIFKNQQDHSQLDIALTMDDLASLYRQKGELTRARAYCWTSIAYNSTNFQTIFPKLFDSKNTILDNPTLSFNDNATIDYLRLAELDFSYSKQASNTIGTLLGIHKKQQALLTNDTKALHNEQLAFYSICKAALLINEQIRNDFSGTENKLHLLKKNSAFINFGIHAALELDTESYFKEAFGFAEQNKSILLADAIKGNQARMFGDLPDSLALLEIQLQQQKDKIKKDKAQAKTEEGFQRILKKENDLNEKILAFVKTIKDKFPKYHAQKYANITAKVEDIQAQLDDETLFLEYFISDSIVYLFVLSNQKIELLPLAISKVVLNKKIQSLRFALSNYKLLANDREKAYKLYTSTAYWFYKELLEKALSNNKVQNLIIVPDGNLGHLPFETFLTQSSPQAASDYKKLAYLIKDYNISYNYSATLFLNNLKETTPSSSYKKGQMLAVSAAYPELFNDSSLAKLRMPHLFELRKNLSPLPEAQKEVTLLSQNFEGTFLEGQNSNEAFFKQHAKEYGIIHLAMHGILNSRMPMLSSLAFSENKDPLEDNFLQAYEITHLHLNADLVVLSACETGFGKFEQGEGVLSLARSFMYAGTPSLVVSLWQVNDASTALIMEKFYAQLSIGIPKDVALREAKLDYLQKASGIANHPAFWSPFIQLGDSSPILLNSKGAGWWSWILGLSAVLLLGLFVLRKKK